MKKKIFNIIFYAILILVFVLWILSKIYTDYLWFAALNFGEVFLISLKAKVVIFFIAAIFFFIIVSINLFISKSKIPIKLKLPVLAISSIFIGFIFTSFWFTVLQFFNQIPFNIVDPIFNKDVSFYVFSLPFYLAVWGLLFTTVFFSIIFTAIDYFIPFLKTLVNKQVPEVITLRKPVFKPSNKSLTHLAILGAIAFILLAVRHYLAKFSIMFSEQGIVVGAGYTDVNIYLPVLMIMLVLALIVSVFFFIWIFSKKVKKRHILLYAVALYFIFFIVGGTFIPALVQSLKVSPNEINLEKPYIENNIKFTRIAYGLDNVEERDFNVVQGLSANILDAEKQTIDNVRILDWRPLTQTYKQTQEIRLYYDLSGIDIDRYYIGGKYTEVMLSGRELNQRQIVDNAKTWVNLHMVYTHGFGVVMSPVNKVTSEGLPYYLIKDIPPVSNDFTIEQPRIYYGEQDNSYVLVNTNTPEFDYPQGDTNKYIQYDGKGGVLLDSFFTRLLMAIRFKDIKILLSSDITDNSKIMFNRNIENRIKKIAPFLELDNDPYIVIDEGKLFWIQDAYTVTGNFPYSQKIDGINYIRNSVKVIVDAYNGDVSFYVVDPTDTLVNVYAKIFPNQFKKFDAMPLKDHMRYPEDLFKIQSNIYSTYHMDDVKVFYNKEDAWQIPKEIYGTGQQVTVEPYYIIMKLPGEEEAEFVLMTSFTPLRKDNLIAWLAARNDGDDYGKLLLFKFPKDKLVYGPLQVEAKIDQDSEISQQLTLWSQQGSRVTRGNLLVIPIQDSLLYIEPLYIQAEQGQLPELKRVLVSDGEKVVMEENLKKALEVLFGKSTSEEGIRTNDELLEDARNYYDSILDSMENKDWQGIGDNLDKLGEALEKIK